MGRDEEVGGTGARRRSKWDWGEPIGKQREAERCGEGEGEKKKGKKAGKQIRRSGHGGRRRASERKIRTEGEEGGRNELAKG